MSNEEQSPVVWSPSEDTLANSRMGQFKAWLEQQASVPLPIIMPCTSVH